MCDTLPVARPVLGLTRQTASLLCMHLFVGFPFRGFLERTQAVACNAGRVRKFQEFCAKACPVSSNSSYNIGLCRLSRDSNLMERNEHCCQFVDPGLQVRIAACNSAGLERIFIAGVLIFPASCLCLAYNM